jgi:hypothetical protein
MAERTRKSIAGSLPEYQGVDPKLVEAARSGKLPTTKAAPPAKSKTALYAIIGVAVVGLGVGAFVMFGGGGKKPTTAANPGSAEPAPDKPAAPPAKKSPEDTLRAALSSANLQLQGPGRRRARPRARREDRAAALRRAQGGARAARAIGARARGARAARCRAEDPCRARRVRRQGQGRPRGGARATRRQGCARDPQASRQRSGHAADRRDRARRRRRRQDSATPVGRDQWLRAAQALLALGDDKAKAALEAELSQADPLRATSAAEVLAKTQPKALDLLGRQVADPEFARRGDAAVALARLKDERAKAWVPTGLKSSDPEERKLAIAVVALLEDTARAGELAALAEADPDRGVQLTAAAALL